MSDTKKCPYCGEEIKAVAKKCRFCGQWLDGSASPSQQAHSPSANQPSNSNNKLFWGIGIAAAIAAVGLMLMLNNGKSKDQPQAQIEESDRYSTQNLQREDRSGSSSTTTSDPFDASNDTYDHWQGMYIIDGYKFRTCTTSTSLNLEKNGSDTYKGTVSMCLGDFWEDGSGRFDPYYGHLDGHVRAKADGNSLTVSIVDYVITPGEQGNFFSAELGHPQLKTGDQIFLITYNGSSYATKAVGKIEHDYDGGDIETKRR